MSSAQTAIVTCIIKDCIEPIYSKIHNIQDYGLPDKSATFIGKIMGNQINPSNTRMVYIA